MKRTEKKGQAGIIVIVLLTLIVIVAFVIIWNVVNILIERESKNVDIGVVGVELDVKDVVMFVTGASKVSVNRRAGGGDVEGFRIVFYDGEGNSEVKVIGEGLDELESKVFNIGPVGIGNIERVSVYPFKGENIGREFKEEVGKIIEIPSGVVSWWRFDDGSDFVGDNDGQIIGDSFTDGELILNEGYFKVEDDDSLDFIDGVSISAWVNGKSDGVIVGKNGNYKVFLRKGKVVFSYGDNEFESLDSVEEDWNHIAVSADFNGVYKIMVNGVLSDSGVLSGEVVVNKEELRIGEGFDGKIDEMMIFDRVLSVEQVEGLFGFGH